MVTMGSATRYFALERLPNYVLAEMREDAEGGPVSDNTWG